MMRSEGGQFASNYICDYQLVGVYTAAQALLAAAFRTMAEAT
jgi:hypothetical protein